MYSIPLKGNKSHKNKLSQRKNEKIKKLLTNATKKPIELLQILSLYNAKKIILFIKAKQNTLTFSHHYLIF